MFATTLPRVLNCRDLHSPGFIHMNGTHERWNFVKYIPLICFYIIFSFSGVKATYLLAVAFLEILRFSGSGGVLSATLNKSNSSFGCVFEYLLTPNLTPAVTQCLTAVVHRAFETMLSWLVCFIL